jgi:ribosomal protein L12E/L44/L45/RPP1/RPP2
MAKDLSFRVINVRAGGEYSVMGCDVAVGYTTGDEFVGLLTLRGLWLRKKKEGDGYMIQWPAKPRMRNGEAVKDAKGYDKYDNFIDLYGEMGAAGDPEKYAITEMAWKFKDKLIKMMLEAAESAPKAAAKPASKPAGKSSAPAARATAARPTRSTAPVAVAEEADEDDDLPF